MRRFLFGTNFKMHHTPAESSAFVQQLVAGLQTLPATNPAQLFIIPPITSLSVVIDTAAAARIWVGAQNMHWADSGAYTGEIAAPMLTALGAQLVMLGHAERRGLFHETDEDLGRKVQAAARHGLMVLLCVGETAEQKRYEIGPEVVTQQLKIALHEIKPTDQWHPARHLLIAYEPVWSIGEGGSAADPQYVAMIMNRIRRVLDARFGDDAATIPVLYGGSVNADNCGCYAQLPVVDGLFVGRAAWEASGFLNVLKTALAARMEAADGKNR